MTDEGDIPSIQCKMSLRGPKSMIKVDDLGLNLIDFYVPALTQRLNRWLPSDSPDIVDMLTHFCGKVFTEQLPSNGYCSHSHRSATGLYATVLKYKMWYI
jgi:hypothetical protein